ncbi:hypothetical protein Pst134EA_032274 [Puccinia striiformis f. sp. tritici]|uniref:uncharacterized protein n=1 Tax=Puccinia striiformis f. sp. tritici TaxID=168172 RepID=UPI002008CC34|nr:uncharacterized protein Pst134EA_032274 [Puccinia striiformis f. sp. tritici]KAH9441785.1 hypothetical protein Pst134EA_032274 [Puccinia striiformis f. sp. tritici]
MHEHETILPAVARDLSPLYQFQAVPPHLRNSARPQLRRFPTLRYDSQRMRYVQANDKPFADLRVLRSGKASQVQLDSMRRSVLQLMANRKRRVGSTERGFPSKRQQKSPQNTANHASFDSIPDRGSSSSWTPVSIRKLSSLVCSNCNSRLTFQVAVIAVLFDRSKIFLRSTYV